MTERNGLFWSTLSLWDFISEGTKHCRVKWFQLWNLSMRGLNCHEREGCRARELTTQGWRDWETLCPWSDFLKSSLQTGCVYLSDLSCAWLLLIQKKSTCFNWSWSFKRVHFYELFRVEISWGSRHWWIIANRKVSDSIAKGWPMCYLVVFFRAMCHCKCL